MILLAWLGLNTADALLTGLSFYLGALELNPFLATLALPLSLERMLLIKLLFAVAVGGCVMATARLRDVPPAELRHDSGCCVQRTDYYLRTYLI